MGDAFKAVRPGEPVTFTAEAWNAMLAAGEAHVRNHLNRTHRTPEAFRQSGIIRVKNESGGPLPRNAILGLDEPIFVPDDSLDAFQREVVFRGIIPTGAHTGKFCVLLDALEEDRIGRAVIEGTCPVQITVVDAYDTDADIYPSETDSLQSMAGGGCAQILYKEDGTGLKWADVRINPPANGIKRAITSGIISACSGTTAGIGNVTIWPTVNGTPNARALTTLAYNWFSASIPTSKHCMVAFIDGQWDIIAVDC